MKNIGLTKIKSLFCAKLQLIALAGRKVNILLSKNKFF